MDPEKQVSVGRYMKFVIVFLLIMFGALGIYEYYYGSEARDIQEIRQQFDSTGYPGVSAVNESQQ